MADSPALDIATLQDMLFSSRVRSPSLVACILARNSAQSLT